MNIEVKNSQKDFLQNSNIKDSEKHILSYKIDTLQEIS